MTPRGMPARLTPRDLDPHLRTGATLVGFRDPGVFGAGHLAGRVNVAIDSPRLGARVSGFTPPGQPLVLLVEQEADLPVEKD